MRLCTPHANVRRIWTVDLHARPAGPALACPHCPGPHPLTGGSARSAALAHLAQHARLDALALHLRTCQCRERGCRWHPRHRDCSGPVLLALTREHGGRRWRLADTCTACAGATAHTAVVPEPAPASPAPIVSAVSHRWPGRRSAAPEERVRVRETLTYLATALPRFCSPTTRLLALQCALRADTHGQVVLPGGFLRGLHLHGHATPWHELEHAHWLRCTHRRHGHIRAQLLDAPVLAQAPGRIRRARAAHWALHLAPLAAPHQAPPSVQLAALALAVHTEGSLGQADSEDLTRLCATPLPLLKDLLDQLTHTHALTAWTHRIETDEIQWQLPPARSAT